MKYLNKTEKSNRLCGLLPRIATVKDIEEQIDFTMIVILIILRPVKVISKNRVVVECSVPRYQRKKMTYLPAEPSAISIKAEK